MCVRRFACVNRRAHVRGTRVYMNLHNKKHGTYVDSAYTFFQFCPYPEDGLPIHCCSVSYSCDVSLRKLKLENCLCTGYFGSPFLPEREKEKKVCRNTRCAFFFFIDYKNRLIFLSCDILRISLIYAFSTSK